MIKNNRFKSFSPKALTEKANLSHRIADHLVGESHTSLHRQGIGVVIMIFGVVVAKASALINLVIIHVAGDGLGYFLHAVGAIPFIKNFEVVKGNETKTGINVLEIKPIDEPELIKDKTE